MTSMHLFRIAQEAVTNAIKHGSARNVRIEVVSSNGRTTLAVHDDGSGFAKTTGKRTGMGMNIMRFRARKIGGLLTVGRNDKGGVSVTCSFQNIERKIRFGRRRDDKIAL